VGILPKVAPKYHGIVIYSRTINERSFGEILFFVGINESCFRNGALSCTGWQPRNRRNPDGPLLAGMHNDERR
jgi:hypothetical protein